MSSPEAGGKPTPLLLHPFHHPEPLRRRTPRLGAPLGGEGAEVFEAAGEGRGSEFGGVGLEEVQLGLEVVADVDEVVRPEATCWIEIKTGLLRNLGTNNRNSHNASRNYSRLRRQSQQPKRI